MTLAKTLVRLWNKRLWVGLGVLVAGVAAVGIMAMSSSAVYSTASTQMLVDSPRSALANTSVDLSGYLARASVFARMMTSPEALQYIGKAAGISGNLIDASGPIEINGSLPATHAPVAIHNGQDLPAKPVYKLDFVQNPSLPTVDVYATAPTTKEAIALANGAVSRVCHLRRSARREQGFAVRPSRYPSARPGERRRRRSVGGQEHRGLGLRRGLRDLVLAGVVREPAARGGTCRQEFLRGRVLRSPGTEPARAGWPFLRRTPSRGPAGTRRLDR